MSAALHNSPLAPRLHRLLQGLRWRIRLYTLFEGIGLLVCWLVATFWLAVVLDYVPVRLGASEMPRTARMVLLGIMGVGGLFIIYRYILCRTFARLADQSMALLLERNHQDFHDSLLTAVEMYEHPEHATEFNQEMLFNAGEQALQQTADVRLRRVFRWAPLLRTVAIAMLLCASVVAFAAAPGTRNAFLTATNRLVFLEDQPWQRMALLQVTGITHWTIQYDETGTRDPTLKSSRPRLAPVHVPFPADNEVLVARGSSPKLTVKAEITEHRRPASVNLYWNTAEESGRARMASGRTDGGFLSFTFSQTPFKNILEDVEFHALGYDFRTKPYRIQVVDAPAITEVEVVHERPDYLVDVDRSVFKTVRNPLIAGTQLPRGSRVTFVAHANKPLKQVFVYNVSTKETEVIDIANSTQSRGTFQDDHTVHFTIDKLESDVALEWMLVDQDGQVTQSPHSVAVGMRDDDLPEVKVAVTGIGSAVTPDVAFPVAGRLVDDYWLERAWLEVQVGQKPSRQLPLAVQRSGFDEQQQEQWGLSEDDNLYALIDFRNERNREKNPLTLQPGDKLSLTVMASDRYNLDGHDHQANPHVGSGDRIQLDVVTPDQLLSLLDRRELELRRRLEQIVEELSQTRDSLVRVQNELEVAADSPEGSSQPPEATVPGIVEPDDKPLSKEERVRRTLALRRLRVQRAVNQSEKSRGETAGVGKSLLDVVAQLKNNRVDSEDRQQRLSYQVSAPLLELSTVDFVELDSRLASLNDLVHGTAETNQAVAALAAEHALAQTDIVLLKLNGVLQKMLDLETFNELLELVRTIIEDQEQVIDETKTLRKKQVFGLE